MKIRRIVLMMLVLCTFGLAVGFAAENPNMGTWKLDEAKSNFDPGATKNSTAGSSCWLELLFPVVADEDAVFSLCVYASANGEKYEER
jgi:hypothetical protein